MKIVLLLVLSILPGISWAKSILVLGDSISAGFCIEVQQGWVALLQQQLVAQHSSYTISNESISGETSAGGLARIDQLLKHHKPDLLLLELGANDGLRGLSPSAMKTNLLEIIKRSQTAGAKVLLLAMKIPPNYGKRYIELFYQLYPQIAAEAKIPYVPFILEEIALNPLMMQADGLHPNADGQPQIAAKIWPYLKPMLN